MRANLFAHIPPVATSSLLEEYAASGVNPDTGFQAWSWVFDAFWKEDWQPLVTLVSRLQNLTALNYGLLNRFPMALHQALARFHPHCNLNIWTGTMPFPDSKPGEQMFLNSNPLQNHLPCLDDYSLSRLRSYAAMCPVNSERVGSQTRWSHMVRHFTYLAACRSLRHIDVCLDSRWGTSDEIKRANAKWATIPAPKALAKPESLSITGFGPHEHVLLDLAGIFDLSTLRSLDLDVWEHPTLLQEIAPCLPNLQKLLISLDTKLNKDPDLYADHQGIIKAIVTFSPLQYLCLRGVRNVATLDLIVKRHGPRLKGLLIEPTTAGRVGPLSDMHFKYPHLTAADILRFAESAPNLRELRLPLKRDKGSKDECGIYRALSAFTNLHCLLLDLHYDTRTAPIYPGWRPSATELREILVNAATDAELARSIWTLVSETQSSKALRSLSVHPFGSESFKMPEAYLLMSLAPSFLVQRPAFDVFEPLEIKCVAEGRYELEVEWRLQEGDGPGRGLTKSLKEVFNEVWPGEGKWQTRWRSFPLKEEVEGA
ncbi:hypothetical protein BDV10DRAFT_189701 [Aspergillus recurvatus]